MFETASTCSSWPDIVLSALSADLNSSKWTRGPSVPLTKCSFGMIPLACHSVDRSPRVFHSSTHNVVRASCFEMFSVCVESRKLFLDGSLCLAGRWPWSGCMGVNFLEAAICVAGNLFAYVGRGYPAGAYKQSIGVAFKTVIILYVYNSERYQHVWYV